MAYRLALDLGTNSIGWAQFDLDERGNVSGLLDGGVHIFDQGRHPKGLASKAADRRLARGMRRNRDRKNRRKFAFFQALVAHGLMPTQKEDQRALTGNDPLELRTRGLKTALSPFEFGRALFHLHQRRGFRSNRKSDGGEDGKIRIANLGLREKLAAGGFETYGAFLASRHASKLPTRLRLTGEGAKTAYEFYPTRDLIEQEFHILFERQRAFGMAQANLQAETNLHRIFFRQREMKSPPAGKCTLMPKERRRSLL